MRIESAAQAPDFSREVHCLLGLPIDTVDLAVAERRIRSAAASRSPCFLSTPNVNWLIACQSDAAFRDSVINSDLSVADGMPLVWPASGSPAPPCSTRFVAGPENGCRSTFSAARTA